jgi:RNA polymerase sigma-70 factor (ECF subfamily)
MAKKKNNKTNEDDFYAIKQVLDGNLASFEFLQKKYSRIVAALIRRMVKNEDDVDDLTQETFIKAFKALKTFQFGYSFSAWLYRIASNTCIDFLRKKRFKTISINQPLGHSEDEQYLEIKDDTYKPDLKVLHDEKIAALKQAIEDLPDNYRKIVKLRHEEELDYKEIANRLELPLGTVKAHLFRARKMMLADLKRQVHLFQEG